MRASSAPLPSAPQQPSRSRSASAPAAHSASSPHTSARPNGRSRSEPATGAQAGRGKRAPGGAPGDTMGSSSNSSASPQASPLATLDKDGGGHVDGTGRGTGRMHTDGMQGSTRHTLRVRVARADGETHLLEVVDRDVAERVEVDLG